MKKLIEWFFSLLISDKKIKETKEKASSDLKKAKLEYDNKVYFNKLRRL